MNNTEKTPILPGLVLTLLIQTFGKRNSINAAFWLPNPWLHKIEIINTSVNTNINNNVIDEIFEI
jgi:hypothetical protein